MASTFNIKRPYITPAIEECFDCESEDWLMAGTNQVNNTDVETGDWEDGESKSSNSSFKNWDDYDDYFDNEDY